MPRCIPSGPTWWRRFKHQQAPQLGGPPPSLSGRVPPRVVSAAAYGGAATEATSTVPLPNIANGSAQDWQPGDAVYIGYELTATTGTITVPAGWAEAVPQFRSATSTSSLHGVLRRVMQGSDLGSTSLVITHTSGRFAAVSAAVQGADTSAPEDTVTTNPDPTAAYPNVEIPGFQPVVVNGLALAFAACRNGTNAATTTFTPPPGFTEFGDATSNVALTSNAAVEGSWLALTSNAMVAGSNATASSSSGTSINQMGSVVVVRGAVQPAPSPRSAPVRAPALLLAGGRAAFRAGTAVQGGPPQAGPPVYPLRGPVRAQPSVPFLTGRADSRAGPFGGIGPPVRPPDGPVTAARPPVSRRNGQAVSRSGAYGGTGPPPRPPDGPVRVTPAMPLRGRAQGRSGVFTAVVTGSGPPVYPFHGPVRAAPQPPLRGRVVRAAGAYAGTGPPPVPPRQPVGLGRRQPPPPARGRTASLRGPYSGSGPPAQRLRKPVRGQPQKPFLTGRAAWHGGVYTAPVVAPFTVAALTAAAAPTATLAPADLAAALTAATAAPAVLAAADSARRAGYTAAYAAVYGAAPSAVLTAADTRAGGPA